MRATIGVRLKAPRAARSALRAFVFLATLTAAALPLGAQETTVNPHGQLSMDCRECHRETGWRPVRVRASFDHAALGYPLTAAHATAPCMGCHQTLTFTDTPTRCSACHQDIHRGEVGEDCGSCHTERSFLDRGRMVQLHQTTRFTLEGSHRAADCESCHPRAQQGLLQFVGRPIECDGCHAAQFASTQSPNHVAAGFSRDCRTCHASTDWNTARFNHDRGGFPLTGAHRSVACDQCHVNNQYTGAPVACVSCHQADYDQTTAPAHVAAQFPTDCATCHGTRSWTSPFNHGKTSFPLTGAHRATACEQCHGDGVFNGKPTTCVPCHQADYDNSTNPDHQASGFPTDCQACHTTVQWLGATFNHDATSFALTGQHRVATCDQCHGDGVYSGKPTACQACHLSDFNATTGPNHVALGWPQTCTTCHVGSQNTTAWDLGVNLPRQYHSMFSVDHESANGRCDKCHNPPVYKPATCTDCHRSSCTFTNQGGCGD